MAVSQLHTLGPVSVAGTVIGGIRSQTIRTGTECRRETVSGNYYPMFQAIYSRIPAADFATVQVARLLDTASYTGLAISATPVIFQAKKKQEGGTRASGSNHISYTMNEGLVIPSGITVRHGGDAEVMVRCLPTYDGTNAVWVESEGQALVTDPGDDQRYTIGSCQLGTATGDKLVLDHITDIEIDFGVSASQESADGDIDPTMAVIDEIMPMVRITNLRADALGDIPLDGKQVDLSHTIFHLRKRAKNSTFVADGTTEHISFVPGVDGVAYLDAAFDVRHNANGTVTILVPLLASVSVAPLTIDTTAAIALPA